MGEGKEQGGSEKGERDRKHPGNREISLKNAKAHPSKRENVGTSLGGGWGWVLVIETENGRTFA